MDNMKMDLQLFNDSPASLNYAEEYLQGLKQKFAVGLRFNRLYETPSNDDVRWSGPKTVQVPRIDTGGMKDVDRDEVGSYTRNVDNSWESKELEHDREFRTLVDPVDIDETNMALTIANITKVFNDEEKIPEMDKYMASKLFEELEDYSGEIDETEPSTENILDIYDDLMEKMDEAEVPAEDRILYVTPKINKMIKNAEDLNRYIRVDQNTNNVSRNVRSLDEVEIVPVPSSRMKTAYDFSEGAKEDDDARQINMILVHPRAMVSPLNYEFVSLDEPSATTGGKYLYYERSYWDVFIFERKKDGVMMNVEAEEEGD